MRTHVHMHVCIYHTCTFIKHTCTRVHVHVHQTRMTLAHIHNVHLHTLHLHTCTHHTYAHTYTHVHTDQQYLATSSRDRLIHVFTCGATHQHLQTLDEHSASITSIKFTGELPHVVGEGVLLYAVPVGEGCWLDAVPVGKGARSG